MIFASQGEQVSSILSHEMNWQGSHTQWLHLPWFRGVTVFKVGHIPKNLRRKTNRQKFNHEGNHRLWNQGGSSCLVLPKHSIVGLTFIHQEMVKTPRFNKATSASDMPRAPTESSRILVSIRNTTAYTRQGYQSGFQHGLCIFFFFKMKVFASTKGYFIPSSNSALENTAF